MSNFSLLVDPLPKSYEGYLINWKFYNGILISQCLEENSNSDGEDKVIQLYTAFNLLFGNGIPPFEIALTGLRWFLNCGIETPERQGMTKQQSFSFEDDKNRIFSAFMVKYGINLNKAEDLHWFEFIALMNDLHKTAFRNVIELREMTPKDMKHYSNEQKHEIMKQKKMFAIKHDIKNLYTEEQIKAMEDFDKMVGLKK